MVLSRTNVMPEIPELISMIAKMIRSSCTLRYYGKLLPDKMSPLLLWRQNVAVPNCRATNCRETKCRATKCRLYYFGDKMLQCQIVARQNVACSKTLPNT
jgi:hypothetical protein